MKEPSIVLSYLGIPIPRYAMLNLRQIARNFPLRQKYFLFDKRSHQINKIEKMGWTLVPISFNEEIGKFRSSLQHDLEFRNEYWFKVMARLLVLDPVFEINSDSPIVQFETDIRISPDFPFDKMSEIQEEVAFPLFSSSTGAASVLFIKNLNSYKKFKKYFLNSILKNGSTTDMKILGEIAETQSIRTKILPTFGNCRHLIDNSVSDSEFDRRREHLDRFGGLFDALDFGPFFFGWDPKNSKGWLRIFRPDFGQLVTPFDSKLKKEGRSLVVECTICESHLKLFNLHVHSKDRRVFNDFIFNWIIKRRNAQIGNGEKRLFTTRVITRRLKSMRDSVFRRF
jgi:hypothetical protein